MPNWPAAVDPDLRALWKGFRSTTEAFVGPRLVQIDVSNPCNLRCACCWTYSPAVTQRDVTFHRRRLDLGRFRTLVDDLAALGTRGVCFAGVGDPVTHADIDAMIEHVKQRDLVASVTTNGTLFTEARLRRWVAAGVDWISVSMLGADEATWRRMHPADHPKLYRRLVDSLVLLAKIKRESGSEIPGVGLSHILCRLALADCEEAVRVGAQVEAASVSFYGMQSFPGIEELELQGEDLPELRRSLERGRALAAALDVDTNIDTVLTTLAPDEYGNGASTRMPRIPCYHGWVFARITADGGVYPCCGSVGHIEPLGNVHDRSFKDIWYSAEYGAFRGCAKNLWKKEQAGFRERVGCEHCPDIDVNMDYHERFVVLRRRARKDLSHSPAGKTT